MKKIEIETDKYSIALIDIIDSINNRKMFINNCYEELHNKSKDILNCNKYQKKLLEWDINTNIRHLNFLKTQLEKEEKKLIDIILNVRIYLCEVCN